MAKAANSGITAETHAKPGDVGARVRAARAYARLELDDLAYIVATAGFRFSARTLSRVESGERSLEVEEAEVIARATGAPFDFLARGIWQDDRLVDIEARLEALEKKRHLSRPRRNGTA